MKKGNVAKNVMINWLMHPNELGKKPAKIEIALEFDYLDLKYYAFKFKPNLFGSKWQLGVCGGYETGSNEHCGHIFSHFNEFNESTVQEDAIAIIEMIRDYWKARAEEYEAHGDQ